MVAGFRFVMVARFILVLILIVTVVLFHRVGRVFLKHEVKTFSLFFVHLIITLQPKINNSKVFVAALAALYLP